MMRRLWTPVARSALGRGGTGGAVRRSSVVSPPHLSVAVDEIAKTIASLKFLLQESPALHPKAYVAQLLSELSAFNAHAALLPQSLVISAVKAIARSVDRQPLARALQQLLDIVAANARVAEQLGDAAAGTRPLTVVLSAAVEETLQREQWAVAETLMERLMAEEGVPSARRVAKWRWMLDADRGEASPATQRAKDALRQLLKQLESEAAFKHTARSDKVVRFCALSEALARAAPELLPVAQTQARAALFAALDDLATQEAAQRQALDGVFRLASALAQTCVQNAWMDGARRGALVDIGAPQAADVVGMNAAMFATPMRFRRAIRALLISCAAAGRVDDIVSVIDRALVEEETPRPATATQATEDIDAATTRELLTLFVRALDAAPALGAAASAWTGAAVGDSLDALGAFHGRGADDVEARMRRFLRHALHVLRSAQRRGVALAAGDARAALHGLLASAIGEDVDGAAVERLAALLPALAPDAAADLRLLQALIELCLSEQLRDLVTVAMALAQRHAQAAPLPPDVVDRLVRAAIIAFANTSQSSALRDLQHALVKWRTRYAAFYGAQLDATQLRLLATLGRAEDALQMLRELQTQDPPRLLGLSSLDDVVTAVENAQDAPRQRQIVSSPAAVGEWLLRLFRQNSELKPAAVVAELLRLFSCACRVADNDAQRAAIVSATLSFAQKHFDAALRVDVDGAPGDCAPRGAALDFADAKVLRELVKVLCVAGRHKAAAAFLKAYLATQVPSSHLALPFEPIVYRVGIIDGRFDEAERLVLSAMINRKIPLTASIVDAMALTRLNQGDAKAALDVAHEYAQRYACKASKSLFLVLLRDAHYKRRDSAEFKRILHFAGQWYDRKDLVGVLKKHHLAAAPATRDADDDFHRLRDAVQL